MLDNEPNSHETDIDKAPGRSAGAAPAPVTPAVPAALFQPPQVLFQPPAPVAAPPAPERDSGDRDSGGKQDQGTKPETGGRDTGGREAGGREAAAKADSEGESARPARSRTRGRSRSRARDAAPEDDLFTTDSTDAPGAVAEADAADSGAAATAEPEDAEETASGRRRRRRTRTRGRAEAVADDDGDAASAADDSAGDEGEADDDGGDGASGRRRRRKRRRGSADNDVLSPDDPPDTVVHVREPHNLADDVRAIKGSTRLEAKKQRRREGRESGRRRPPVITESEFLARRESVERTMVVRQRGDRTQIAVLEDGVLVEHYVNRTTHASYVGNVYLGKVQNVLPSMEAAFVDIGKGRNAVLYAGEVNFDASGLEGQPKRIESALKPGQSVIVQVTKDPVGHKGARLTSQVSLPGRYLVYVPGASMTGISRKLPDTERTRLKQILKKVTPEHAGVIVRTAAEGAAEAELDRDITRLAAQWESIEKKSKTATAPALLYGEPDLTVRVIRDVFNEDFSQLIVSGDDGWETIDEYVRYVAPHLADRISRWDSADNETEFDRDGDEDVFAAYRIDEQLAKALERKVWLPSGGSLVIDRTEAMTVIDVNTGKFTGQGGNLEETVTRNNLEAAEEIVRQLRLRDVGGIIVIDFIDMVLESNRELVLRRLLECLARDRTKHQVAEVTSLGLVQMTRKRVGAGLLEAFSQQCECCNGRGVILTLDTPAEPAHRASAGTAVRPVPAPPPHAPNGNGSNGNGKGQGNGSGNGKSGYGNGRRNRRDEDRAARDTYQDTPLPVDEEAATAAASTAPADSAPQASAQPGTAPASTGSASAGSSGTAQPATRRPTSAGTAFATAVLVEDSAPLVPVVATVPSVAETPSTAPATADDAAAPPVRRTRAGSAVARVTVVTEPAPEPAPAEPTAAEPTAAEPEPAPAADAAATTAETTDAASVTPSAETPAAESAEPAVAPAPSAAPEYETAAPAAVVDEAVPPTEQAALLGDAEAADEAPEAAAAAAVTAAEPPVPDSAVPETPVAEPSATAEEAAPAGDLETPAADALEQATEVAAPAEPEPAGQSAAAPAADLETPTADAVEQATEVAGQSAPDPEAPAAGEPGLPADLEVPTADAVEQATEVPSGDPEPVTPPQSEPTLVPASLFDAPAAEPAAEPAPDAPAADPAPEAPVAEADGEPTATEPTTATDTDQPRQPETDGEAPGWA